MSDSMLLKKLTHFLGRSGMSKCSGFIFIKTHSKNSGYTRMIYPITSKGLQGRAWLEIPEEDVGKFCACLQGDLLGLVLDNIPDLLPTLLGLHPELDREISNRLATLPVTFQKKKR